MQGALIENRSLPWVGPTGLAAVLAKWQEDPRVWREMTLATELPGADGLFAPMPEQVPAAVQQALASRGVTALYAHQAQAYELARGGTDVVVATPTASGKSLCFNLPVLGALAGDPQARALYLFPTKALARDQEEALRALMRDAGVVQPVVTYDGDTPGDVRKAARDHSAVILTNPDMLHAGILPHHARWARLLANLRYVVIDELHTYRGVFGSHLANVLRRLIRVARFHSSKPTFIFASATIGNPREHASRILGRTVELVANSGAPAGPRRLLLYNPPVVNAELGMRGSYVKAAVRLTTDLVRAAVPTIVFGRSRNTVEVMLRYLRDRLAAERIDPQLVQGYRGGYLPGTRRRIEAGLRAGDIRCVVATNALELGIDIGMLDAVVCAGYPGSVAELWQRFGRAGRRQDGSLALLVASSTPLDQYFATKPQQLVGAPIEQARIDPDNVEILIQHVKCATFELPLESGEAFGDLDPPALAEVLAYLAQHRVVHALPTPQGHTRYHWATDTYPANHVSLRSVGWDNVVIVDLETQRALAEMDWRSSHTMLHEQAIYQHDGRPYQVERLDYDNHKAFVRRIECDYYTDAMTHTRVAVLQQDDEATIPWGPAAELEAGVGEVSVVEKVVGYKKIKYHTHENLGYGDVLLPEIQMHTTAFWLTFPRHLLDMPKSARPRLIDAIRGLGKAMHTVAAVGLMIDTRDLGRTLGQRAEPGSMPEKAEALGDDFDPTLFFFDHIPGGIGLAPRLFEQREHLLEQARQLVASCCCADGCPVCIGPAVAEPEATEASNEPTKTTTPVNARLPQRKDLALQLLGGLRGAR